MAVVTDQQGQAVRLARVIGVDQQPGSGAVLAPGGKSGHGAPLPATIAFCLAKMPQHEGQLFESTSFIYQEVGGGRGKIAPQATRSRASVSSPAARRAATAPPP